MKPLIFFLFLSLPIFCYSQYKPLDYKKPKIDWSYIALETSYIALNIADYATTIRALNSGNPYIREINPMFKSGNPYIIGAIKFPVVAYSILSLRYISKNHDYKYARNILIGGVIFYSLLVANNTYIIIKFNL